MRLGRRYTIAIASLAALILVAAVVNVPIAVACVRPFRGGATTVNVIGPGAAPHGWPVTTPHAQPWPVPRQWSEYHPSFGNSWRIAWGSTVAPDSTNTTHQVMLGLFGWPLPALQEVQLHWPFGDPAWATGADPNPGLQLRWSGVLLNPLIIGGSLWALFVLPVILFLFLRERSRVRQGHCPECGYDLRGDLPSGCPECGWNRPAQARLIGPAA